MSSKENPTFPVPPPPNTLAGLTALFGHPVINGLWYHKKEVHLDGYKFQYCRFDECTLIVSTTNFQLDHCIVDAQTKILFGPIAAKPIRLYHLRHDWAYQQAPYFAPVRNEDGTISLV